MTVHYKISLPPTIAAIFAVGGFAFGKPALADVKIVSTVTASGKIPVDAAVSGKSGEKSVDDAATRKNETFTTYFKGSRARRESDSNPIVMIYDRLRDRVYTIDTQAKTYFEEPFKDAFENGSALPKPVLDSMNLITDIDIDGSEGAADSTRQIAGVRAEKYTLFGAISAGPKSANTPGFSSGGGPFSHGTGGTVSSGDDGSENGALLHFGRVTLNGSLWTANAATVMPMDRKDERELSIALLQQELPTRSPILKSYAENLAKKKLLPLASRISVRFYDATGGGASAQDPNASGIRFATPSGNDVFTLTMEVKSIDATVSLDDTLFQLPPGLERVQPPAKISPLPQG